MKNRVRMLLLGMLMADGVQLSAAENRAGLESAGRRVNKGGTRTCQT